VYDRAWMVSADEARAMRRWGGAKAVDVASNGVDGAHFRPGTEPATPRSCVFWGRLDAEPNVRAVAWFCRNVWPTLRPAFPDARFGVYGFAPTPAISSLAGGGVAVVADVPDLRPELRRHEVAVMPFVSGAGIKNKLLEAAALGLPIVTSPRGCAGLDRTEGLPFIVARRPSEWTRAIGSLWRDPDRRARLGAAARDWVLRRHTWSAAAKSVLAGLGVKSREVPACPSNSC
jgi:glycosyltransferase involved in cell wall biosynthesis